MVTDTMGGTGLGGQVPTAQSPPAEPTIENANTMDARARAVHGVSLRFGMSIGRCLFYVSGTTVKTQESAKRQVKTR
jgi:hypothetical protein